MRGESEISCVTEKPGSNREMADLLVNDSDGRLNTQQRHQLSVAKNL